MPHQDTLHLTRWTVTSGSNAQSRGAVVITAGDHHWQASSQGNGAIDALYGATDKALAEVLEGHPRLVGFVVRSLEEGPGAEGLVSVTILPPAGAEGARAEGEYSGQSSSTNIIAAAIDAYIQALNQMLHEAHWAGAAEVAAAGRKGARSASHGRRAEYDSEKAKPASTSWFDQ